MPEPMIDDDGPNDAGDRGLKTAVLAAAGIGVLLLYSLNHRIVSGIPLSEALGAAAALVFLVVIPGYLLAVRFCPADAGFSERLAFALPLGLVTLGMLRLGLRLFVPHAAVFAPAMVAWGAAFFIAGAIALWRDPSALRRAVPRDDLWPWIGGVAHFVAMYAMLPGAITCGADGVVYPYGSPMSHIPLNGEVLRGGTLQSPFMAGHPLSYWALLVPSINTAICELSGADPHYVHLALLDVLMVLWLPAVIAFAVWRAAGSRWSGVWAGVLTFFSLGGAAGLIFYLDIHLALPCMCLWMLLYDLGRVDEASLPWRAALGALGLAAIGQSHGMLFLSVMLALAFFCARDVLRRRWRLPAVAIAAGLITIAYMHAFPGAGGRSLGLRSPLEFWRIFFDDEVAALHPRFWAAMATAPARVALLAAYPIAAVLIFVNAGLLGAPRGLALWRAEAGRPYGLMRPLLVVCAAGLVLPAVLVLPTFNPIAYWFFMTPLIFLGNFLLALVFGGRFDPALPGGRRRALGVMAGVMAAFAIAGGVLYAKAPGEPIIDKALHDAARVLRTRSPIDAVVAHRPEHWPLTYFSQRRSYIATLEPGKLDDADSTFALYAYASRDAAQSRLAAVARIMETGDAAEARALLTGCRISHLYVGPADPPLRFDSSTVLRKAADGPWGALYEVVY